ncbi:hypothetical protein ASD56_07950 [Microbacterium sp. Root166]|uniref:prepilin-type N-terminal cleavage/methylation domain-containing protein n=1 Tax=Microbacterium sp. Root166 TaxID=1736478 RepID=UPI00070060C4|nr:prepilin-type N-terminal cleavage/methylation domain-containing protein [Microbacterium sp. Root166]KQZ83956.1 hypothetical protein ASD56_07950 [Microbacterium sp. Root166]
MRAPKRQHSDESGLGLIELIVAIIVGGIIMGAVVMIFVNSWRTQEEVTTVTQATNRGQLVGATIERAMRNALFFEVDATGTELRVRTSLDGELQCQGFRIVAGAAQMTTDTTTLSTPSTSWPTWQSGVVQRPGVPFFVATGDVVVYTFDLTTESAPVRIKGEVATRSMTAGGSGTCWS